MKAVTLNWQGPYGFKDFLRHRSNAKTYACAGVYLWKESEIDGNDIAYIGKATGAPTLYDRHVRHLLGYIGGSYLIPAEYRKSDTNWSLDIRNSEVLRTVLDEDAFKDVVSDAYRYVDTLRIFVCPQPAKDVAVIERNLLYQLQPKRTRWGTLSRPAVEIEITDAGALVGLASPG